MMVTTLTQAQVILLAVHLAAYANIESLTTLIKKHKTTLQKQMVLRILLTHLPETLSPSKYIRLLRRLDEDDFEDISELELDLSPVGSLTDEQAIGRVRRLHLSNLGGNDQRPSQETQEPLVLFLYQRSLKIDAETGALDLIIDLLLPFCYITAVQLWTISTVLPLYRRSKQYYVEDTLQYPLKEFGELPACAAVDYLLSRTARFDEGVDHIARDLNGLLSPWLLDPARWTDPVSSEDASAAISCTGWEQTRAWLAVQATNNWQAAVSAFTGWDGPSRSADIPDGLHNWLNQSQQDYLEQSYTQAALAAAYLIPDTSDSAIQGVFRVLLQVSSLMKLEAPMSLDELLQQLPDLSRAQKLIYGAVESTSFLRHDLMSKSNALTLPTQEALDLLLALLLSASILTRLGTPCCVRSIGDMLLLREGQVQKTTLIKALKVSSDRMPSKDDLYWAKIRKEVLWLHNWGDPVDRSGIGALGAVPVDWIEAELLKSMLENSHYKLAAAIYDDASEVPLPAKVVQDIILASALNAFDKASNPNRARGGLKKCNEIIHALPQISPRSLPSIRRVEALLKATHALSDYRLVLKQGEPFHPVVLRVHSDPITIIEKVLEQNPEAYTRLNEFLEMGLNLVAAGLPIKGAQQVPANGTVDNRACQLVAEKRILSMCIEAALREDDFETAYSYVVNRTGPPSAAGLEGLQDEWSWDAALKAGQYIRTQLSQQPTHLGTSSGNLEIRHLEQRIECLATALRVAPSSQLQEILKTFRRCEEQLDSAIKEEADKESALDAVGDVGAVPGAFETPDPDKQYPPRNMGASAAYRQNEEAPMSLFDLSRATARIAQKNLTTLSDLQGLGQGFLQRPDTKERSTSGEARVRKRDQFREAATGSLVSGVGWLIGANPGQGN